MQALWSAMMGEDTMDLAAGHAVEALLRGELVRENRAAAAVVPVLRHLLSTEAQGLVSDVILARVRGMTSDLAAQLLAAMAGRDPAVRMAAATDPNAHDALIEVLLADAGLMTLCHALANEALLAERFQQRHAIDPVLSPLLQELIASEDPAISTLAMSTLASQSRFMQSQRRMELPLAELPAEAFHGLIALGFAGQPDAAGRAGLERLQAHYDEAASRLGLLARLVATMGRGAMAALALDHAGIALFASALSAAARHPRVAGVLACHEGQGARLALLLRAAGAGYPIIERQFMLAEPSRRIPRAIAELSAERAAALLMAGEGGA
jgi:hypothetical protein